MEENKLKPIFDEVLSKSEIITQADGLILELFNYVDEFIDIIKNIVTKGGNLNESRSGDIRIIKVKKILEEVERIFIRIDNMVNPPEGQPRVFPNIEETNELINILNEDQIPMILRWMNKVFINDIGIYDNEDRIKMYDICLAFNEFVDSLRVLISRINGNNRNYNLPEEFELPYDRP